MIRIRSVERKDLDELFTLDHQCFPPGIAYSRTELRRLTSSPSSISVAAEDEAAKLAGFAIAELHLESGQRIGHIVTIDVVPTARRIGIGHALMRALLERLCDRGVILVRLEVAVDNEAAQAFYFRHGFVETGHIPRYYLGRIDALAMEKALVQADGGRE